MDTVAACPPTSQGQRIDQPRIGVKGGRMDQARRKSPTQKKGLLSLEEKAGQPLRRAKTKRGERDRVERGHEGARRRGYPLEDLCGCLRQAIGPNALGLEL